MVVSSSNNNNNNNNNNKRRENDSVTSTVDPRVGRKLSKMDSTSSNSCTTNNNSSLMMMGMGEGTASLSQQSLVDMADNESSPTMGRLSMIDGSSFTGISFGAHRAMFGEVVFNTGMVGYPEALSDPSYKGQILVLTYPMIGNYGVPDMTDLDEHGLPKGFESNKIQISGLIVQHYSQTYSHWNAIQSLGKWLKNHNIPALYQIDTRQMTKLIREHGSLLGKVEFPDLDLYCFPDTDNNKDHFEDPNARNLVAEVSTKEIKYYGQENRTETNILAIDCGMKFNIIRYFVNVQKVKLTVVPWDYDLINNPANLQYNGIFLSNGPGDPLKCDILINNIRWLLNKQRDLEAEGVPIKPIFGICLGNQIMALASGAKTYKMKYGNRGMNQPCIDMRTGKCYITPQNHGYAVDSDSLDPKEWKTFFLNANDYTNEGIVHVSKPYYSVQFHPEACGGPMDTAFLFEKFRSMVEGEARKLTLLDTGVFQKKTYRKVLLVGSGGLSIGQAGEFDYSGAQAIKALKEEDIEVVLINPNIATVQTSKSLGKASPDKVYFLPIKAEIIEDIIAKERPDGIIVSMGGQTALNVGIELYDAGILKKYSVEILGTQIPVIVATEDREIFSTKLAEINETLALSYPATNIEEAVKVSNKIGYPVLIRAAFALGGLGSGFAENDKELIELAEKAFAVSDQILIDQDLRGWKELEYEVVRDCRDNCITVCNMENFDPLGVHTGDSIVVAPSQTLSNDEYYMLRETAIKVVRHLGIVGECNIQYALNPQSKQYCIIEVNARLSRSSALASKATGYPLAYVAAKLSLGIDLVSIKNSVTKTTTACFEPSLDYCVIKVPRWDLDKFHRVQNTLGSSMTSVGEVMAIGRNFEEAIQKAVRMVNPVLDGLEGSLLPELTLDEQLKQATHKRLFAVQAAFEKGRSIDNVHDLTKIDKWFLAKLKNIASLKEKCMGLPSGIESINAYQLRELKMNGFSDKQIGNYLNRNGNSQKNLENVIRRKRLQWNIKPCVKQIDTLAAEFPAQTNYLYMTYNGVENDTMAEKSAGVLVLGCGAYCIGSSVEFDWCAVSAIRQVRETGYKAIVVNCNPETVSTDYDESDKLYFEELTYERVLDIYEHEQALGAIVSVGGQIPNNLAAPLHQQGVNILGTSPNDIDRAEDRHKFSAMLDSLHIDQPQWKELVEIDDAIKFGQQVGYPVLVRPSFVLSGAAMNVASNAEELRNFLCQAAVVSKDKPVVITKFILNAKEIEFDAVAKDGHILNYAISEHVENAGVHSGDATLVLPAQRLYVNTVRQVKCISSAIAKALNITGPFNIQLMAKGNEVKVIECNLRASRTFPFISKTFDVNLITLATQAMLGVDVKPFNISLIDIDYVAVKAPMFSFTRLRGADPRLGVEMASTGEVACFGLTVQEAFLQALVASGFKLPVNTKAFLISIHSDHMRLEFLESVKELVAHGYILFGTAGTAKYYKEKGIDISVVSKAENDTNLNMFKLIKDKQVDVVINIPEDTKKASITDGYKLRRLSVDFGVPLITNIKCAALLIESLLKFNTPETKSLLVNRSVEEYYKIPTIGWRKDSMHP